MAKDMFKDMDYEMPEGVGDVKSEGGFEYYQHPLGIYMALVGRLKIGYKNLNNEKCEPDEPGAYISYFNLPLWITRFLGTTTTPENKSLLEPKDDKIIIPTVQQAAELYFNVYLSYAPKDQWSIHQKFSSFHLSGHENMSIVRQNPAKPTEKVTNFRAFPAYYGMQVKFVLDNAKSKTGKTYLGSVELLTAPRISGTAMNQLEQDVQMMIEKEIAARKSNNNDDYVAPPPPSADGLFEDIDTGDFTQS